MIIKPIGKMTKTQRAEMLQGYSFLTVPVIIKFIFLGLSVLFVLYISFSDVNLFKGTYVFNNFKNYHRLFSDKLTRVALKNTFAFSIVVVPLQTIIAIVLAATLNSNIKGKLAFRSIYFLPTLTSSSALTLIFMFLFSVSGPLNVFLLNSGLLSERINFLNEPSFTMKVIMAMNIWSTFPMYMTMYLASLQDIPKSMYEAASIDGATVSQSFFYITVPYLKPITTYVLLTGIIGTLQMFDQAYIFSNGSGGPANSTLTISLMIYKYAFGQQNSMGYAATLAIFLAVVIFTVSMIAQKLNNGEERVF